MLKGAHQRRITYLLLGICVTYLIILLTAQYHENIKEQIRPLRAKPIKLMNSIFGFNISTAEYFDSPELYKPQCRELMNDNQTEMSKTMKFLQTYRPKLTENDYYLKATINCDDFIAKHNLSQIYHQIPLKFPTAYIITTHTSVQQLRYLLHAVYNEHNLYCIHIDNSSDTIFRNAVEALVNCIPNVFVSTKSESVIVNDHSELRAEFHCLRDLISLPTHWRYVMNLDETSFPLKTNSETTDILRKLGDYNMIEGSEARVDISDDRFVRYKYRHEVIDGKLVQTQDPKDIPPSNVNIRHGSPFYAATRNFVQFVLSNYYATEFYNWLNETYAPKELFWATMNHVYMRNENLAPANSTSTHYYKIKAAPTGNVANDFECYGVFEKNTCILATTALPILRDRKELFAGRFDMRYDTVPVLCMDEVLTNPYDYDYEMGEVP